MKAIVINKFGNADVLVYAEVQDPEPKENEVLIHVQACGLKS